MIRKMKTQTLCFLLFALLVLTPMASAGKKSTHTAKKGSSMHQFTLKDIDGKDIALSSFSGKGVLLVNVASNCGYTYQYKGLQALHSKYAKKGLVVIGVPANNFGGQEPGNNSQIKSFCTSKYKVSFPMMSKISVKGVDIHPLYKWLTNKQIHSKTGGDIRWNFNKFLIGKDGKVVARYGSGEEPDGKTISAAIEKLL